MAVKRNLMLKAIRYRLEWLGLVLAKKDDPAYCSPLPDGRYRLVFHPKITATEQWSNAKFLVKE
jgi:hypothetical protein